MSVIAIGAAVLVVIAIGAAVLVGINPDIQSEITGFFDGLGGSSTTPPPPGAPQLAPVPQPIATPVQPSPTPLPPFEWATVVTSKVRALESGAPPATGYYAGWFGMLSDNDFAYDGRTYTVLEVLYHESDAELSVRLDSCLLPSALYGLRIGPTELRWPISETSKATLNKSSASGRLLIVA